MNLTLTRSLYASIYGVLKIKLINIKILYIPKHLKFTVMPQKEPLGRFRNFCSRNLRKVGFEKISTYIDLVLDINRAVPF